jgi:hypothetical protein
MKANPEISLALALALIFLPACSASQARSKLAQRQAEIEMNNQAWLEARKRLKVMCDPPPTQIEVYRKGIQQRAAGGDPFKGCDIRLVKLTNAPVFDDWQWDWLPSYQTIVQIHDEELRLRLKPKVYDEYMLGLSRYLAQKTDRKEISPQQMRHAFNEGWRWMFQKMGEEMILLEQSVQAAQISDAAVWNTLGTIAAGLALVAAAALVSSATAPRYPPPTPINCTAVRTGNIVTVHCF